MGQRHGNYQLFALRQGPPQQVRLAGAEYLLEMIFKHDFFAATCLYVAQDPCTCADGISKIVVKFPRDQAFCGLSMEWMAKLMCSHEEAIYHELSGVCGVPRWMGRVGRYGYAIEHIDAQPLDHQPPPPPGFFDKLRLLFDEVHERGVGYCDANKQSNILVDKHGRPYLVDYQISIRHRDDLPWPLSAIARRAVAYVAAKDIYHLYKHKRRISPQELTAIEQELSRRRGAAHLLHSRLTKTWRTLRRAFLRRQFRTGQLVSPTAELEQHYQPEKETWRTHSQPASPRR